MEIWRNIEILIRPKHWSRLQGTCKFLDYTLNTLMDDGHKVKRISKHEASIGGLEIWVENYPYSFAYVYGEDRKMPSRKTCLRIKRMLPDFQEKDNTQDRLKRVLESNGIF